MAPTHLGQRLQLLETIDVATRLDLATDWVNEALSDAIIREEINATVSTELDATLSAKRFFVANSPRSKGTG
ncbi:MAG: hypothetical protein R2706_00645 [Acidimicrobiales bacterium]